MNVLWDLVVHDVAILGNVMPERPSAVSAMTLDPWAARSTASPISPLFYPSGAVAHVHASWLAPVKLRRVIFGGDKSMVVYDDLDPSEKIWITTRESSSCATRQGNGDEGRVSHRRYAWLPRSTPRKRWW